MSLNCQIQELQKTTNYLDERIEILERDLEVANEKLTGLREELNSRMCKLEENQGVRR